MLKFTQNNAKYGSIWYIYFEFNYKYHLRIFYKNDINPPSKSKVVDKFTKNLRNLILICRKNFIMFKNCQNVLITKRLSLEATFQMRKFS